uniref:Uncharacterized protein n=1 Tax=Nelumbo nucifera TaxID=4432 RepID=A0A822Z7R9_NELNU|nr:TPA_asm: hypothetical protein HUJ06_014973 [Nelumbo nucifera]
MLNLLLVHCTFLGERHCHVLVIFKSVSCRNDDKNLNMMFSFASVLLSPN